MASKSQRAPDADPVAALPTGVSGLPEAVFNLRFLFVVGKGGVGKTTLSAALALALARRGRRVLLAQCHAHERLGQMLGTPPLTSEIQPLLPGIEAVNMHPDVALREYGRMVVPVPMLYQALFENRTVASFLRGIPGLEAWSMLGKAYFHTQQKHAGKARYDTVIVDAPATGHALDMLRVPQVLSDVAPPGLLRREAEAAMTLFRNAGQAGVVLVTLLEDMPVSETIDLDRTLRNELSLPVAALLINRTRPRLFCEQERACVEALQRQVQQQPSECEAVASLVAAGHCQLRRERAQDRSRERLVAEVSAPTRLLPEIAAHPLRRAAIEQLAGLLVRSSARSNDAEGVGEIFF